MASTRLTDVFVPELVAPYDSLDSLSKNTFINSGVGVFNPKLTALMDATSGGSKIIMPFWNPITEDEPNVGSDDPATKSTPVKTSAGTEIASKTFLNKSFSAMQLTSILAGSDPMTDIMNKIEQYWNYVLNARMLNAAAGIIADSVANHDSDLVLDISANTGAEGVFKVDADTIIQACGYLGDRQSNMKVIAMHPVVYTNLRRQNLIDNVKDSDNNTLFEVYGNMRVLVDNAMPVVNLAGSKVGYHTYIFGDGVFSIGSGYPGVQEEVEWKPDAGNGMGEEVLYTRRCFVTHPNYYSVKVADTNAGMTYAQLAAAGSWERVVDDRRRINFVAIISQG